MSASRLFAVPDPVPEPVDVEELVKGWTAEDVKTALRRRHPGETHGSMVGQWTCIDEWLGIDLLALNAWTKADVIGYEVKISRSDLRRELLKPHKRASALARTTEFYLAVPAGLLLAEEIAYTEPEWEHGDFKRAPCPGVPGFGPPVRRRDGHKRYGGRCSRHRIANRTVYQVPVPIPDVVVPPEWLKPREGEGDDDFATRVADDHCYRDYHHAVCWACGGKGYAEQSRVEREAPTVWVPRDVGLITVSPRGTKVVKPSPKRKDPTPIAPSRKALNVLVRWVSHRPDPRHRST